MLQPRISRRLAPWVLAAAIAAPSPAAALDPRAVLHQLGEFFASLWVFEGDASTRGNGCLIDPNGLGCSADLRGNGCVVDPDGSSGSCSPVLRDNGCVVDPDGSPRCAQ